MENLTFINGDPGAVQFGNFINYYQFHPPENRLDLISYEVFDKSKPLIALDIGCNAGNLTITLFKELQSKGFDCHILGIDIDPILIKRAQDQNECSQITFECIDFMEPSKEDVINNYLEKFGTTKFSAIFCFSVTMWIHLNHGDSGLKTFLEKVCNLSEILLVEPQPWKCYRTALKRVRKNGSDFPLFKTLQMKSDVEFSIEKIIEEKLFTKVFESDRTKWERKIVIYKSNVK